MVVGSFNALLNAQPPGTKRGGQKWLERERCFNALLNAQPPGTWGVYKHMTITIDHNCFNALLNAQPPGTCPAGPSGCLGCPVSMRS